MERLAGGDGVFGGGRGDDDTEERWGGVGGGWGMEGDGLGTGDTATATRMAAVVAAQPPDQSYHQPTSGCA